MQLWDLKKKIEALTSRGASVCIEGVKWLALVFVVVLFGTATSCTTLVNRRDLYSPEPGPDSLEAMRRLTTTTTTTTTMRREVVPPSSY
jgi:hypothetical protein